MFLRRNEPVLLREEGLDGLCASLNRPVVDLEDLPVGPARAAIALYRQQGGERGLLVTVRSEGSGVVALFEFRGDLHSNSHQALDQGLTFAEGMGFLFDEDVLAAGEPDGRRRAFSIWLELTGDESPDRLAADPGPAQGERLVLDDLESDLEGPLDSLEDSALLHDELSLDPLEDELIAPETALLSKFRTTPPVPPAQPAPPARTGGGAELARIPILRRRRTASDEPETPPLLTRLLARF